MKKFSVQRAGQDCVPAMAWSADLTAVVGALQTPGSWELLVLDPVTEKVTIVPQLSVENLLNQVGNSVASRLAEQIVTALPATEQAFTASSIGYLLLDLAQINHAPIRAIAGALVALLVTQRRAAVPTSARLIGLASQAQCWLQQTGLPVHQLLLPASREVYQRLYRQLREQDRQCDTYVPEGCATQAAMLVADALALATGHFETLQSPTAWQLLRVAVTEQQSQQ